MSGPPSRKEAVPTCPRGPSRFSGRIVKTWEPGTFEELLSDVSSHLFGAYGDDNMVYPGHGDDTTLGVEASVP